MRVGVCAKCGAAPLFATVCHPLHFKGTTMGTGECRYEPVPYCARCDAVPNFAGSIEYFDEDPDEFIARRARELQG